MARKRNATYPDSVQPGIPVLGPLPEGWVRESLGKRLHEIKRPVKMRDECTYNLVTVKRNRGGAVKRDSLQGKEIKVKSQFEVHSGDFLISKRQIVHGACALVPEELHGAIVSNEYAILGSKKDLDLTFLRYLSETKFFQETCFHSSIGVHVEKMVFKLDRWLKWEFNFPSQKEQQKIARILSTWDAAITCTQKLLESSKQQKKALMQQLLTGRRRLPGHNGKWTPAYLKSLLREESKRNKKSHISLILSVTNHSGFVIQEEQFSKRVASKDISNYKIVENGQFAYNPSRINVGSFARLDAYPKAVVSPLYTVFSIKNVAALATDYFMAWMRSDIASQRIALSTQGSVRDSVNFDALCALNILLPPLDEQKAIAKILTAADAIIAQYEAKLAHLQRQKKALMQQLLTGKIRVTPDTPDTSGDASATPA
ncbi:restriction endonuclease subunit S [Desulfovibrio sp.]|uniref:restriction endonuclease subunit S n=1 Tax=Desulfovibrio sp. TaxID=885 RepID=UPI0025C4F38C|nr:restriction endonuclease subunit S [Desulfovibrio sp.]